MTGRALSPVARAHGLGGPAADAARAGNGRGDDGLGSLARRGIAQSGGEPPAGTVCSGRGALVRFVAAQAGGGADRVEVVVRPAAALPISLRRMAGFHRALERQVLAAGDSRGSAQSALLAVNPPAGLAGVVAVPGLAPVA